MHDTAMDLGREFFKAYVRQDGNLRIVEIGAQNVNGSLRDVATPGNQYIGVDFVEGKGVDVIMQDPYALPFESESVDVVLSSSVFEHSEFFWLLFTEIQRILKPGGLFYLNVPSNGFVHRFPADCWRFYPDSGIALQNWGRRNGYQTVLLESFTARQKADVWNDFVAVFARDARHVAEHPRRLQSSYKSYTNGYTVENGGAFTNATDRQEDQELNLRRRMMRLLRDWYSRGR
jgi:SAM-dependent methyltransferase